MNLLEKMFGSKGVSVEVAQAEYQKEGNILVDVRSREEVADMGIPGATNIPLEQIENKADTLKGYTTVYVSCRSGGRSSMAVQALHDRGITQAVNVNGGILAWKEAGLPTTP